MKSLLRTYRVTPDAFLAVELRGNLIVDFLSNLQLAAYGRYIKVRGRMWTLLVRDNRTSYLLEWDGASLDKNHDPDPVQVCDVPTLVRYIHSRGYKIPPWFNDIVNVNAVLREEGSDDNG